MRRIEQLTVRATGADKKTFEMRCTRASAWDVLERVYRASGTGILRVGVAKYVQNASPCLTDQVSEGVSDGSRQEGSAAS